MAVLSACPRAVNSALWSAETTVSHSVGWRAVLKAAKRVVLRVVQTAEN